MAIHRVRLSDPPLKLDEGWHTHIVPRLYAFADLVYELRADDSARYRYLLSMPQEQRAFVAARCPHLVP